MAKEIDQPDSEDVQPVHHPAPLIMWIRAGGVRRLVRAVFIRGKDFWITMAVVAASIVVGHCLAESEADGYRVAGLLLQLFGLGAAAYGVRGVRKVFKRPSLLDAAKAWVASIRAALRTHPTVHAVSATGLLTPTMTATGTVYTNLPADATTDEKVEWLLAAHERLKSRLSTEMASVNSRLSDAR